MAVICTGVVDDAGEKAAVLGAGTMGAQIAAHLANAGVPTVLLDIAPRELNCGRDQQGPHTRIKRSAQPDRAPDLKRRGKLSPRRFTPDTAALVSIGNFEDDLVKLKDCDLIIEAVVENLEIKRKLYERVDEQRKPDLSSLQTPVAFPFACSPDVRKIFARTLLACTSSIHRATCIWSK